MAAAIAVGSFTANAGISLQQSMQMNREGHHTKVARSGLREQNSMKLSRQVAASRFHKMMTDRSASRLPKKVTPKGDNIYGYLYMSLDPEAMPPGLYEFQETQSSLVWADDMYQDAQIWATTLGYDDGVLKGYAVMTRMSYLTGVYYLEYSFEDGMLMNFEEQDMMSNTDYLNSITVDSDAGMIYGYGAIGGVQAFGCASLDDPTNYTFITDVQPGEFCIAMTYSPEEQTMYAVNANFEFVRLGKDGRQEVLMQLPVDSDVVAPYLGGLVFDPVSRLFYWNLNRYDDTSAIATIDINSKTLDIYDEFLYGEQFVGFFTTDTYVNPLQPMRPSPGEASFYKDSLSGYVSFTMPAQMNDGADIPEGTTLGYRAYVDGELYSTGSALAGEEIQVNFVASPGAMHTFGLTAVNNGVESYMASVEAYVGNDTPVSPRNVTLTETGISWDEVTRGVHDGYIDEAKMRYRVFINGEELTPEGGISETSLSHSFDPEADLASYRAEVKAVCNGMEGNSAYSNSIAAGAALQIPQYIAPTEEEFSVCTVIDSNGDGQGWELGRNCVIAGYSLPGTPMDDWFFLPKMAFADPDRYYSFAFDIALRGSNFPNEYVSVELCSAPDPSAVIATIAPEFSPESEGMETAAYEFKVPEAGAYYIALHCTSDADMYGVIACNFSVEDYNITDASPLAADDLAAVPDPAGALKAAVTFSMPVKTMGGEDIDAGATLTATISGGVADVVVNGKPGQEMSAVVETEQGNNTLTVMVSDGDLNSPVVSTTVRCGYDVPSNVNDVISTVSADMMSMKLEWEPVTTGWISDSEPVEGIINPAEVEYDIYLYTFSQETGEDWELLESVGSETSYVFTVAPGTPQDMFEVGVVARNSVGDNGYLVSATGILGTPYGLPIDEDFEGFKTKTAPWVTTDILGQLHYRLYHTKDLGEAYADYTTDCMVISADYPEDEGRLGIPRFTTRGAGEVTLTLEVSGDFTLPETTIYAQSYGMEPEAIGTITVDKPGFNNVSIKLPSEYLDKDWVGIGINCLFNRGDEVLAIERLTIDNGTGVRTIEMSGVKIAGGKNRITVSGLNGENVTISALDGRVAARSTKVNGNATFSVDKGIYVVKAGDRNAKVVVR